MIYRVDYSGCFAQSIGAHGLESDVLAQELHALEAPVEALRSAVREAHRAALTEALQPLPDALWAPHIQRYRAFETILVLGTGGSNLAAKTLYDLKYPLASEGPKFYFLENVDPHTLALVLNRLDWSKTGVIAISKSGKTPETLTQFLLALQGFLKTHPASAAPDHFLVITEERSHAPLKMLQEKWQLPLLPHPKDIGGRFSAFSVVALFPAAIAGVDIAAVRRGGAEVLEQFLSAQELAAVPAILGTAVIYGLWKTQHINETVLMPYIDRLETFTLWFRQLWAESLGKDGQGWTPIPARGAVDQHSQLQLYLDGPRNKLISLVLTDDMDDTLRIAQTGTEGVDLSAFVGRSVREIMRAQETMVRQTLKRHQRPARIFTLSRVDEAAVGALFMHFMLETFLSADLLGVNPQGQPAIEDSKILFYDALSGLSLG